MSNTNTTLRAVEVAERHLKKIMHVISSGGDHCMGKIMKHKKGYCCIDVYDDNDTIITDEVLYVYEPVESPPVPQSIEQAAEDYALENCPSCNKKRGHTYSSCICYLLSESFIEGYKFSDKVEKTSGVNYAMLIDADEIYPVSYTIQQDGTRIDHEFPVSIKGGDLTENQIKELVEMGFFNENYRKAKQNIIEKIKQFFISKY